MWTVFKKELREGWLFLLVNIVWLMGVPSVMGLLFPGKWDADATSIFCATMFGVFIPLYLVILAVGLVQDENTFLVRGLPVKPWKMAGGKLLYLALNFVVLEGLSVPYMMGPVALPDWLESDLLYIYLWLGATAVSALAGFAFATFLPRKSYAFFASLLATVLGMGSLLYLTAAYTAAVAADRTVHLILGASFLFLIAGAFALYHDLLRQSRLRWSRAAVIALLLPAVAGVLWLRAPLWLKQTVVGNPYYLSPAADDLFVTARMGHRLESYLFDAGTGDLRAIPFIGDAEYIVGTDPDRGTVYTATVKTFESAGEGHRKLDHPGAKAGGQALRKYSALDPVTGKTRDLGLLPARNVSFEGDIARWTRAEDKNRFFGFKDLVRGTAFEISDPGCRYVVWGKDGVLYDTPGPDGPVWKFVDFATAQVKEAFKGEHYPWPWSVQGGYFLFEGPRDFSKGIPCDRTCYNWDPATGTLQKLGPGRPVLFQGSMTILIRGQEGKSKALVLFRDGREISTLPTEFLGGYPVEWFRFDAVIKLHSPWRFVFFSDENRESKALGVMTIEGDKINLKTVPLPVSMINLLPIPGSQDLLLFVKNRKDSPDWDDSLCKVYRLDPATGKMRRLV